MGFRHDLVKQTVEQCLAERQGNFPMAEELASLVMQLEDREQAASSTASAALMTPLQRMIARSKTTSGAPQISSGVVRTSSGVIPSTSGIAQMPFGAAAPLKPEEVWSKYRDPAVTAEKMREENTRMRDQYLCKVCMENEVRVTFMPCGHLACCGPCSLTMSECPICRSRITGCVRTYF